MSAAPDLSHVIAAANQADREADERELKRSRDAAHEPLIIEPASAWADRDPPPPRDWNIQDLAIAAGRVTSFLGNGGFGKTMIATQIAVAVATNRPLLGMKVSGGPVVGIFCEDEQDDIERRGRAICAAEGIPLSDLDRLHPLSRDGEQNLLCTFHRDQIVLTDFYYEIDATLAEINPRLTILDTAADIFAGDFMNTTHVRQFIKVALGGYCKRHGTAVLLLAHPSASAMASGDGAGFSVAWHNSVRSRLFLRKPKSDDDEATKDRRVLEVKKSNYGPSGAAFPLVFDAGRFTIDPEPIEESASKGKKSGKTDTGLAIAIVEFFKQTAAGGQVVAHGRIYEHVQAAGLIEKGHEKMEANRKRIGRTLKHLEADKIIAPAQIPRGSYRLVQVTE